MISRRPQNLGVSEGRLASCPASPNCVCSQAADGDSHRMPPIPWTGSAREAIERLVKLVETSPRTRIVTRGENYLHAEFTSALLRFVDDVEFLIDEAAGVIHFRSASRVGYSDFGVNRRRMEQLCERFLT
jgi:uncharacterized protein (DUF1499 family)